MCRWWRALRAPSCRRKARPARPKHRAVPGGRSGRVETMREGAFWKLPTDHDGRRVRAYPDSLHGPTETVPTTNQVIPRTTRRAPARRAAVSAGVGHQRAAHDRHDRHPAYPLTAAGEHAVRRQADHRRSDPHGGAAGAPRHVERLGSQRPAGSHDAAYCARVRAGDRCGHALPRRIAGGSHSRDEVLDQHDHPPHGALGHARSRTVRGQRGAGPLRTRAHADVSGTRGDGAGVRTGPDADHDHQLRGRAGGVRAVADRAAVGGARAGVRGGSALQRAGVRPAVVAYAAAPVVGVLAADGYKRRNREGSEDFWITPLFDRPIPRDLARHVPRQSHPRDHARKHDGTAHRDRHGRLLHRVWVHRVAHAHRAVQYR